MSNWRSRCWSGHSRRSKHLHSSRQVTLSVLHLRLQCEEGVGKCGRGNVWEFQHLASPFLSLPQSAGPKPWAPLSPLLPHTFPTSPHYSHLRQISNSALVMQGARHDSQAPLCLPAPHFTHSSSHYSHLRQISNSALMMRGARHKPQAPIMLHTSPIHPHTVLTSGRSQTAPA